MIRSSVTARISPRGPNCIAAVRLLMRARIICLGRAQLPMLKNQLTLAEVVGAGPQSLGSTPVGDSPACPAERLQTRPVVLLDDALAGSRPAQLRFGPPALAAFTTRTFPCPALPVPVAIRPPGERRIEVRGRRVRSRPLKSPHTARLSRRAGSPFDWAIVIMHPVYCTVLSGRPAASRVGRARRRPVLLSL